MFSFFKKKYSSTNRLLHCDIHSHLLAGIDDGAKNWDDSIALIRELKKYGFSKVITTPHIMTDVYNNTSENITILLHELATQLAIHQIDMEVLAAAEYYLDKNVFQQIQEKKELITFGNRYLLFETNFLNEPYFLKEFIFQATTQGYQVVMAHPERYGYMTMGKAEDLKNRGVLFQLNTLSLNGFYSRPVQKLAQQFIDKKWINFLGSDCHNLSQAHELGLAMKQKYYYKVLELPLLNYSIK